MPTAQPYENIEIVRESTINLKKVQENDWSLQCDRILVYGRGFESKMQSWVDIHKKVKEVHPKGATLSMDEVQARYDILTGNRDFASRLELLTLSVEDEVLQKGIGLQLNLASQNLSFGKSAMKMRALRNKNEMVI